MFIPFAFCLYVLIFDKLKVVQYGVAGRADSEADS